MRGAVRVGLLTVSLIAAGTVAAPILGTLGAPNRPPVQRTVPAPRLGLPFISNGGQPGERVSYVAPGEARSAFFTSDGMRLRLESGSATWILSQELLGARSVQPRGAHPTPTTVSYFHGPPAEWQPGLETFDRIVYPEPWPGIDVAYTQTRERLKYRFVVRRGADPASIGFRWSGATDVGLDGSGRLEIETGAGTVVDEAPTTFQMRDGEREPVSTRYRVLEDGTVGFDLGRFDPSRRLVIDPALVLYGGFIGGPDSDDVNGVAVDGAGSAYLAGTTTSMTGFPTATGPDLDYNGGARDAFIAKLTPSGTAFEYVGFIGGDDEDVAVEVAVDGQGSAYVTGDTRSASGFPATVGPDTSFNGQADAFIAKVNPAGTALEYAGFLGGTNFDFGRGVAIDAAGAAYVGGRADPGFPAVVGPDATVGGTNDVFVAKVAPGGGSIIYSGFVGGDGFDDGGRVAVDPQGRAYVVGSTQSASGFPTTVGPDASYGTNGDAFVARINAAGTGFEYAGYIGGSGSDSGGGVAVDTAGRAHVVGGTNSTDFPAAGGGDASINGGRDAFLVQVSPSGDGFVVGGYVGGAEFDDGNDVALDPAGTVYLGGNSQSAAFTRSPRTRRGFSANQRVFVARLQPGNVGVADVTFIGGGGGEDGGSVAIDGAGNQYVAGESRSMGGLGFSNGPDPDYNGGFSDGFVAKLQTAATCKGTPVTVLGSPEKDTLEGTNGDDVIDAGGGNDIVSSLGGRDLVCARDGNDRVDTGKGTDVALGEAGNDRLNGGAGKKDRMIGGKGKDRLRGGGGAKDTCKGGPGKDRETGGECEKGKV